jgi:HEAT repeat protein
MPELLAAIRNEDQPFPPLYLYRLSDLSQDDLEVIGEVWLEVPVWRRRALFEDIVELAKDNTTLSFEALDRLALHDPDPHVRRMVLEDLNEYETIDLVPDYLDLLTKDPDPEVRAAAGNVLGYYLDLGALEELEETVLHQIETQLLMVVSEDTDQRVRQSALEALGASNRPEVAPLIQTAYESTDRSWVVSALIAIARSGSQDWAAQVLNMLGSPYPAVRGMAARAAGELDLGDALDPLVEMLDDDNDEAHMAAIWSLSQIGGEGVREHLQSLAAASDDEEEVEFILDAIDNLDFTEDIRLVDIFDLSAGGAVDLQPRERSSVSKPRGWEAEDAADEDFDEFGDDDSLIDDLDELDDLEFDDDLDIGGSELDTDRDLSQDDLEDQFDDEEGTLD